MNTKTTWVVMQVTYRKNKETVADVKPVYVSDTREEATLYIKLWAENQQPRGEVQVREGHVYAAANYDSGLYGGREVYIESVTQPDLN